MVRKNHNIGGGLGHRGIFLVIDGPFIVPLCMISDHGYRCLCKPNPAYKLPLKETELLRLVSTLIMTFTPGVVAFLPAALT